MQNVVEQLRNAEGRIDSTLWAHRPNVVHDLPLLLARTCQQLRPELRIFIRESGELVSILAPMETKLLLNRYNSMPQIRVLKQTTNVMNTLAVPDMTQCYDHSKNPWSQSLREKVAVTYYKNIIALNQTLANSAQTQKKLNAYLDRVADAQKKLLELQVQGASISDILTTEDYRMIIEDIIEAKDSPQHPPLPIAA